MATGPTDKPMLSFGDPIDCFPYEVWVKCVCFAAYGEVNGPLLLLLVSKKWEKAIMETPEAWTSLIIDSSDDIRLRAEIFLHLSKHCLIDIHIAYPHISWDCLKMILDNHGAKMRAIIIQRSTNDADVGRSLDSLLEVLTSKMVAPNMQEFLVQRYIGHSSRYYFLGRCPQLVRVVIYNEETAFSAESIRGFSRTIKQLSLDVTLPQDFKILAERQNLTSSIIINRLESKDAEPFFNASCSRLQELWYTIWGVSRPDSFVNVYYPRLYTLKVKLIPASMLQVLESLHHFPELRHLEMDVLMGTLVDYPMISISSNAPRLTSYTLRFDPSMSVENMDRLINAVADGPILDDSRILEIVLDRLEVSMELYNLLCKAPRVQVLRVVGSFSPDASRDRSLVLPNLEVLSLTDLGIFAYIKVPKLAKLTLLTESVDGNPPLQWAGDRLSSLRIDPRSFERLQKHSVEKMAGDPFPFLRHIIWDRPTSREGYQTTLLKTITSVEFQNESIFNDTNALDTLLLSLLQYPDACPTLSTIKSYRYPCWDLLLATVQERNANPTVADIQSLFLPGYPPSFILQELINALRGIREGTAFPVFDPVIQRRVAYRPKNACRQCITAGYSHCREDDPTATIRMTSGAESFFPLENPELYFIFDDEQGAQEEAEANWKWWEEYLSKRSVDDVLLIDRVACHRHSHDLVSITQFSLHL